VVIHIAGRGRKRRIESIARVVGFDGVGYQLADALETPFPELPPFPQPHPLRRLPHPLTTLENCHDARSCFPFSVNPLPSRTAALPGPPCGARAAAGRAAAVAGRHRAGRRFLDAVGRPAAIHPRIHPGAGGAHRRGHHHHRHGPRARLRRHQSGGFRKLIQIVFGLSIAFAASSFFLSFFSFSGGAVV
jgi:hypothetical protein